LFAQVCLPARLASLRCSPILSSYPTIFADEEMALSAFRDAVQRRRARWIERPVAVQQTGLRAMSCAIADVARLFC
jgi:hypothetical protein